MFLLKNLAQTSESCIQMGGTDKVYLNKKMLTLRLEDDKGNRKYLFLFYLIRNKWKF